MSETETQRLWKKLDEMGRQYERVAIMLQNQTEKLDDVSKDVKLMSLNGCAKSSQHTDHETRIRDLEASRNMAVGGAGILGALLGSLGGWLMQKIGGHG